MSARNSRVAHFDTLYVLALLFPRSCFLCERCLPYAQEPTDFCRHCQLLLRQQASLRQTTQGHYFLYHHQGIVKTLIKQAKAKPSYRTFMNLVLLTRAELACFDNQRFDAAIPMPSKYTSLMQRQFSPAFEFAAQCTTVCHIPMRTDVLRLRKKIQKQSRLSRSARKENVADAFEATAAVKGTRLLLVDDVLTTGATMQAAKNALLQQGAGSVTTISLTASVLSYAHHETPPG